jgi:hypothetical protein
MDGINKQTNKQTNKRSRTDGRHQQFVTIGSSKGPPERSLHTSERPTMAQRYAGVLKPTLEYSTAHS